METWLMRNLLWAGPLGLVAITLVLKGIRYWLISLRPKPGDPPKP